MESCLVHVCNNDFEASQIDQILSINGIECQAVSDISHSVFPFNIDGLGEVRIYVLGTEFEKANQLILKFLYQEG